MSGWNALYKGEEVSVYVNAINDQKQNQRSDGNLNIEAAVITVNKKNVKETIAGNGRWHPYI